MAIFRTNGTSICGISTAVPQNIVENESYSDRFDAKDIRKFSRYSGVNRIHKSSPDQTASDLGYSAAEHLIKEKGISKSEIGILIFVTLSPDYRRPPTSCVLQYRLGLDEECACWDIGHGCSGFIYGHQTMLSLMDGTDKTYGLMILGETTSKLMSASDRSIMLFGDAGSAVLYKRGSEESHVCMLKTRGSGYDNIIVPGGGFRNRFPSPLPELCDDGVIRTKEELRMKGVNIHDFSTVEVPKIVRDYMAYTQSALFDYNRGFFHQANKSILDILNAELGIDEDKAPNCLNEYGNTSCTSIPLMICDFYGNKVGLTERVLCCGFGVGLSWGVTSFTISSDDVYSVIQTGTTFPEGER